MPICHPFVFDSTAIPATKFLLSLYFTSVPIIPPPCPYHHKNGKVSFFRTWQGGKFIVDYTLDTLEQELDTRSFLRINRQFIAHLRSVKEVHPLYNAKLKIILEPACREEVIVSREKANVLKNWMGR